MTKFFTENSNLLEGFVDDCIASGVDGCAVTSEEYKIHRYSCHDRFGILKKIARHEPTSLSFHRDSLNPEYVPTQVNALRADPLRQSLYF